MLNIWRESSPKPRRPLKPSRLRLKLDALRQKLNELWPVLNEQRNRLQKKRCLHNDERGLRRLHLFLPAKEPKNY